MVRDVSTGKIREGSSYLSNTDSIQTGEISVTDGRGFIGLPNHHISYASGLTNEEVARFTLAAGDSLEVWRLETAIKGGGTDANVSVDVYDVSDASVIASTTAGSLASGTNSPLGTSTSGATIAVRVSTDASSINLCTTGITSIIEQ